MKRDSFFLICLAFSLVIFYPDLFLGKAGPLVGDHLVQHFPWASLLAESLKKFELPFWTPLIHCGFPIAAESQIGVFYLPNLILYGLLPFRWGYSYMNLFHFWVAGWGTYAYARRMNLDSFASFIAAFAFVFGTAYGGAYYNMTSLKTVAWFPVALYLFEQYYGTYQRRYLTFLVLVLGSSVVAGYLQVAVFMLVIFSFYALLRIFVFGESDKRSLCQKFRIGCMFFVTMLGVAAIAFPQLWLSFNLALRSNRVGLAEDYAYIGSMSPLALITVLVSSSQGIFNGNSLYVGIFAVMLVGYALSSKEVSSSNLCRIWVTVIILSFLLAVGGWSPLYVGLVKLTKFYSFRTPMKFLVFICFGLSMIAAAGFHQAWRNTSERTENSSALKASYFFLALVGIVGAIGGIVFYFLTAGRNMTISAGYWFIDKFIYGQAGHPHSLEFYRQNLIDFLDKVWTHFAVQKFPLHIWAYGCVLVGAAFALFLVWKRRIGRTWLLSGTLFLFADLYGLAWGDIKLDFGRYLAVIPKSSVLAQLSALKAQHVVGRIYSFRLRKDELPMNPNLNMLYGFEDVGVYSPLVMKRYFEVYGRFGNMNDSNRIIWPRVDVVLNRLALLSFVDVSHIISQHPLEHPDLELRIEDSVTGTRLYENMDRHQRAYFISRIEVLDSWEAIRERLWLPGFDPREVALIEKDEVSKIARTMEYPRNDSEAHFDRTARDVNFEIWEGKVTQPGLFVLTNMIFPGWNVQVNGTAGTLVTVDGMFQGVWLPEPGSYELQFRYHAFCFPKLRSR